MLIYILWSRTHWPSSLSNGNQIRFFVYEQRKDWSPVPTIYCSFVDIQGDCRDDLCSEPWARSRHHYIYFPYSGNSWLWRMLAFPFANSSYFTSLQLYGQAFTWFCWYNFGVQIGEVKRLWGERRKTGKHFVWLGRMEPTLITSSWGTQWSRTQSLNTGLSCLPSNSFWLLRFWESLLTTRFYSGCSVIFFFFDIGAQSFERISALRI